MKKLILLSLISISLMFAVTARSWSWAGCSGQKVDSIIGTAADTVNIGSALFGASRIFGAYYLDTLADKSCNIKMTVGGSLDGINWFNYITCAAGDSWTAENTWTLDTTRWATFKDISLFKAVRLIFTGVYSNQKARVAYRITALY